MTCCLTCHADTGNIVSAAGLTYIRAATALTVTWYEKVGGAVVTDGPTIVALNAAYAANTIVEGPCSAETLTELQAAALTNGYAYTNEVGDVVRIDYRLVGTPGTPSYALEIYHVVDGGAETLLQTVPLASFEIDIQDGVGFTINAATNVITIVEEDQDGNVIETHTIDLTPHLTRVTSDDGTVTVVETAEPDGGFVYDLSVRHISRHSILCYDTNSDGLPDVSAIHRVTVDKNSGDAVVAQEWEVVESIDPGIAVGAIINTPPPAVQVDCLNADCGC